MNAYQRKLLRRFAFSRPDILVGVRIFRGLFVCLCIVVTDARADDWRPLFNGKDLSGWETWLAEPYGLNNDPKKIFSVVSVDGEAVIRLSGEVFGALTTTEEFENYHLRLEFKWGEKRWPPAEKNPRNSGLLYHCVGAHGAESGYCMEGFEVQIAERDCGDYYSCCGTKVDVTGERRKDTVVFAATGQKFIGHSDRIIKGVDAEKPHGEWNQVELLCVRDISVAIINGKVVMRLTNLRKKNDKPLTRGRFQLLTEGAEIFFRKIELRSLKGIPQELF